MSTKSSSPPPTAAETRHILLALSTSRYSQHLVEHAIAEADAIREAGEQVVFHVLYVIEEEELERASHAVGEEGFLGIELQADVVEALARQHDLTARRRIEEVRAAAKERNIRVTVTQASGRFVDTVIAEAEKRPADIILVTRADRPWISRFLFGSECDRVARVARREGLGRVIIDEDE